MAGGPGSYVLGAEERKEVLDVLDGGNLFRYGTPGVDGFQAKVVTFENEMAERLGHKHVVATSSGTGSLMCCLAALGIGMGDEVIVPGYTFIASIATIAMMNAIPVLAEIDESLTIDPTKIEALITPKTKAIMPVHMLGNPCDMDPIMEIAREHHLTVIEDSACGIYSRYKGKPLGTIGDMGMWSFDAMKILVCADGSALYFKDPAVREKAAKWLYFGLESKSGYSNSVDKKWWEYDLSCFGHRSIMNDVTAAMALEQLKKLPGFIARRHEIAAIYDSRLAGLDWLDLPPALPADCSGTYYFYHVQTKRGSRDDLAKFLRDNDVYTTFRYFPLHRVPAYGLAGSFPNADYAADHTLCLPIHQALTDDEVNYICDKIIEFGKNNNL